MALTGDFNNDGVVDLDDWPAFVDCMEGSGATPNPELPKCIQACLDGFDFESDGDVDLKDAAAFERVFMSP